MTYCSAHIVLLAVLCTILLQGARAELVRVELSGQAVWQLTNANQSVRVDATVPAHTLTVLSSAGITTRDPLYRYGEQETRWVAEDRWNFTVIWPGKQHLLLAGCRQIMLVMHGIDTFGTVVLNGRHVLQADNAHRSWWVPLESDALREGANMLSVVLHPAAETTARAKAAYPYPLPTMQVPHGVDAYNFARKPASDFGWDWGPAFVPAGITGSVELVGFDRATVIGALVSQAFNHSSNTFELTVTAHFVVPAAGDKGILSLTLATLELRKEQQVVLQPGVVGGNQLQALVTMHLSVPAARVTLWQPLTLQPQGKPRELYDLAVMFEPEPQPEQADTSSTCGLAPHSRVASSASSERVDSSSHRMSTLQAKTAAPEPDIRSAVVRRIGFRTIELVRQPVEAARQQLLASSALEVPAEPLRMSQGPPHELKARLAASEAVEAGPTGESFYLRVNGVPLFAKGANVIPLHVLSTTVTAAKVRELLQSAVAANMNMVRIWGGGLYQVDELYTAADELGLLVWQEAMFACSPYPRNAAFLANVEAEVVQQLLRLGSHASLAVFGGNNEVEQSLDWYQDTSSNPHLYATDYAAFFVDTIGGLVHKMLPHVPWVDTSPSRGTLLLPPAPAATTASQHPAATAGAAVTQHQPKTAATSTTGEAARDSKSGRLLQPGADEITNGPECQSPAGERSANGEDSGQGKAPKQDQPADGQTLKRWGFTNDPLYGDIHFYNYKDDCQDWRTYPKARFISEYGWQSYPTWPTYSAATAEADWQVATDMTEFRQRHPNGTAELLAQLHRRFKLPQTWLHLLLPHKQQRSEHQNHSRVRFSGNTHEASPAATAAGDQGADPTEALVGTWSQRLYAAGLRALGWKWPAVRYDGASKATAASPFRDKDLNPNLSAPATAAAPSKHAVDVTVGVWHDRDPPRSSGSTSNVLMNSSRSRRQRSSAAAYTDMQHFIYLTQLQQMLCYETALQHWRRLRSDGHTLTMGVLYWQLNDVWAGASWSSIDYGGQWKPLHYGVARVFADVTLSVQHDELQDTITVFGVNDLLQPAKVRVSVRLLGMSDSPSLCGFNRPSNQSDSDTSSGNSRSSVSIRHSYFKATPYARFQKVFTAEAPAAAATRLWSSSVDTMLQKAGPACSRDSCYVHIVLSSEGQAVQEATVWLAPFKSLPLKDPKLSVGEIHAMTLTTRHAVSVGHNTGISFTVSSQAVAPYVVWGTEANTPAGRFSDNALTIHPCEPRTVIFMPRVDRPALSALHSMLNVSAGGRSDSTASQDTARIDTEDAAREASDGETPLKYVTHAVRQHLVDLLQEKLLVTSLWSHQQFIDQQPVFKGHAKQASSSTSTM